MNILLLIILAFVAFVLQYALTFIQMRSFSKHYRELREGGRRVAIGRKRGAFNAGLIVMFAIDDEGTIVTGRYMQGVTVFARFKSFDSGFEGKHVGSLSKADCKAMHLAGPLSKAVLDASSNYNIITAGGEVPTPPSPLQRLTDGVSHFFDRGRRTRPTV